MHSDLSWFGYDFTFFKYTFSSHLECNYLSGFSGTLRPANSHNGLLHSHDYVLHILMPFARMHIVDQFTSHFILRRSHCMHTLASMPFTDKSSIASFPPMQYFGGVWDRVAASQHHNYVKVGLLWSAKWPDSWYRYRRRSRDVNELHSYFVCCDRNQQWGCVTFMWLAAF